MVKADTITADYLTGKRNIEIPKQRRKGNGKFLKLKGATGNVSEKRKPRSSFRKLVVVTGISGSGKSSLINGTLYPILNKTFLQSGSRTFALQKI
ncbi:MAG: hypothetical protein U0T85_02725 [Cloacibacterium normanense]